MKADGPPSAQNNGETTFLLHHESGHDFVLDFWLVIASFNRFGKFFKFMATNKINFGYFINYLPFLFA